MNEAIERYLQVEEAQQTILQGVDDSIAHFEATGLTCPCSHVIQLEKVQGVFA